MKISAVVLAAGCFLLGTESALAQATDSAAARRHDDSLHASIARNKASNRLQAAAAQLEDSLHQVAVRQAERDRRAFIIAGHWPKRIERAALAHNILIGMTEEAVCLSWGEPDAINTTITAGLTREQWVYGPTSYLYLDNGVVTAIQRSR